MGNMGSKRVAIVGMGAVGTTTAIHLMRSLHGARTGPVEIHCFEKRNSIAEGLAYSTKQNSHLLNIASDGMSVFPDLPDDFENWLCKERGFSSSASKRYVPRYLFAEYLKDRFDEAARKALSISVHVNVHFEAVTDCQESLHSVKLTAGGTHRFFDHVVLCLGHLPQKRWRYGLTESSRYFSSPWDLEGLARIDRDASIGILGTSLTAVDALLSLEDVGFRGKVTCFSRRRKLPHLQSGSPRVTLKHFCRRELSRLTEAFTKRIKLSEMMALLKKDFMEVEDGPQLWREFVSRGEESDESTLERAVARVRQGRYTCHSLLESTTDLITEVWNCLGEEDKKTFQRRYESIWAMFRHSMPVSNAEKLLALVKAGRLCSETGLSRVAYRDDSHRFEISTKKRGRTNHFVVDYLIDATSTELDLANIECPLLSKMAMRGEITGHPFGGIDVDRQTSKIRGHSGDSSRISLVGILTKGVHFYTNSFAMNRDRVIEAIGGIQGGRNGEDRLFSKIGVGAMVSDSYPID